MRTLRFHEHLPDAQTHARGVAACAGPEISDRTATYTGGSPASAASTASTNVTCPFGCALLIRPAFLFSPFTLITFSLTMACADTLKIIVSDGLSPIAFKGALKAQASRNPRAGCNSRMKTA